MKIDLHVHIKRTFRCAKHTHIEMAVAAKEKGLDGVVLLDHHYFPTNEECSEAENKSGVKIFKGIEITIKSSKDAISGTRGGANDVLVIAPFDPDFNIYFRGKLLGGDRNSNGNESWNMSLLGTKTFRAC